MSNKSGFELRADLLSLAEGILSQNIQRRVDATFVHNENNPGDKQPLPTDQITAADIISVASELNTFVETK